MKCKLKSKLRCKLRCKFLKLSLLVGSLVFLKVSLVQANEINQFYRPVRSMSMGGVSLTTVLGAEAVFLNAAALQKIEGLDIHAAGINIGLRMPSTEDLDAISNIDENDPSTYNDLFGRRMHLDLTLNTAIATPYFGFGYYRDIALNMELNNPSLPSFNTYLRSDEGYVVAGAMPIGQNTVAGISLKRIHRQGGGEEELGVDVIADAGNVSGIIDRFGDKGVAHGIDLSFMTKGSSVLNPTLAVVLKDVGNTTFTRTAGTEAPAAIEQNLVVGGSVLVTNSLVDWTLALEADHLLDHEIDIGKKIHLGTELALPFLDIRAGFNQGYFTYGAGFDFYIFRLDAASYFEEVGVYPGQRSDPRYMLSISIDLSFDATFKITDSKGKRYKLKQRR